MRAGRIRENSGGRKQKGENFLERNELPVFPPHLLTAGSSELGGDLAQSRAQPVFADRMPDGLRRPTRARAVPCGSGGWHAGHKRERVCGHDPGAASLVRPMTDSVGTDRGLKPGTETQGQGPLGLAQEAHLKEV